MKKLQIQGDRLDQLNVNGQPKTLLTLVKDPKHERMKDYPRPVRIFEAHPIVDAFNAQSGTNLKVVSYDTLNAACKVEALWEDIRVRFWQRQILLSACTTDALIAYPAPRHRIRHNIVFSEEGGPRVVQAAGNFKGERGIALVGKGLTSADVAYSIKGKGQRTIKEILEHDGLEYLLALDYSRDVKEILQFATDRLVAVPNFSHVDGEYKLHAGTGIPHGRPVNLYGNGTRDFRGMGSGSYVGRLVCCCDNEFNRGLVIGAYSVNSRLAVVAEVSEEDTAKIKPLINPDETPLHSPEIFKLRIYGASRDKIHDLYQGAIGAVEDMNGEVDAKLLGPVRDFLAAMGKGYYHVD